jgi:hypothetical protein
VHSFGHSLVLAHHQQLMCRVRHAGRYGSSSGLVSSNCTGLCDAGTYCAPGSTSPAGSPCPVGQYSTAGLCLPCPAGRFGNTTGLTSASCSGLCRAGRWGGPGSGDAGCEGPCAAGYRCPPGSTSEAPGNANRCPAGKYSALGDEDCFNCSAGFYGTGTGLETPKCSGECQSGYYCPEGSIVQRP